MALSQALPQTNSTIIKQKKMKQFKSLILAVLIAFAAAMTASAQNISVNVLTQNSGLVNVGGTVFLEVTVCNTSPTVAAPTNKIRVQVSAPAAICNIPVSGHNLPAGWSIVSNTGSVIRVCNGTDAIPANGCRTILIALQGTVVGGPSTVQGQLQFTNGTSCSTNGGGTAGDNTADNSSTSTLQVNPAPACALTVSASAGAIACNGGTTTLTATPSGATGPVEYSLNGGPFQSGNTFTVNAAGSPYVVTAREVATPSCSANSSSVTVSQPAAILPSGAVSSPIVVNGGTGAITVTATGGTGAYSYAIVLGPTVNTSGASSGVFSGLSAGSYVFSVTDANNCSANTAAVVLNQPAACNLTVSAVAGTIACNGGTTTLTATAAGNAGAVEYSLNGGAFQSSNVFNVNAAGSPYVITAREVGNTTCTATTSSITVTQPTAVSATASVSTAIAVPGGTGAITVVATGGTGAKTYVITSGTTINTTGATSGVFTGLLAGSYVFTATDANGCTGVSAAVSLANPGIATADPAVGQMFFTTTTGAAQDANNLLLAPAADLYDINIPFYNLNQLNPVPNGTISFRVNLGTKLVLAPGFNLATAPLGAYFTWSQAVESGGNVVITGTQIAAIPADFDAIARFRVKGDSACASNVRSNIMITNQLQTLQDDDLQNNTARLQYNLPITVSNSQVNVTCNGAGNGVINIVASSGTSVVTTGPAGYNNSQSLASGQNNLQLTGLAPGVYNITVSASSDAPLSACTATTSVTITQPTVLTIPAGSISSTNNNCFGAANGTITVAASGGTPPYVYTIAGPTVNTTGTNSGTFTGLTAGSYVVTATDNNGCAVSTSAIVITQPVGGVPDITLGSDISGSLFANIGSSQTIVYNIAEIAGNAAVGDTLRITKVAGFTINFNPTIFSTTVGGTTYTLDNPRWKIDDSNPAFTSIILTDPLNASAPGTLNCLQLVRIAVSITRNTSSKSTFTLSARLRRANGEINLSNNLNSIVLTAD
jgi:large repetitive protein